ncbi:MAG: DUF6265 family protein [Bacteroidetes bacterium]|nr:DUF6265 family protein [Bacteroidota bacterium]
MSHGKKTTLHKSKTTMRYILTPLFLFFVELTFAQSSFPDFLQGTWKMENNEIFEHWDKLNENSFKGFSYKLKDGQMTITEYLEISETHQEIIYTATVLNQNEGKGVSFKGTKTDSTLTFENPGHDFPKKIVYKNLNEKEMFVQVSDDKQKGFAYKMQKQFQRISPKDTTVSNPN